METLNITLQSKISKILVGEKLAHLSNYLPANKKIVIITDRNVYKLYGKQFPVKDAIMIGIGEENKTLQTAQYIYEKLIEKEVDRSGFIVGIGGGIVCDVTGYIASTYMRGIKFGFVSTTLLAQVDASIGGKNGINLHGYKNMIGVFSQPEFVIIDFDMLATLPEEEFRTGFAEIIKHACIKDNDMFKFLEENYTKALEHDYSTIYQLVNNSLLIKRKVVENDEKETGERRILNFGHTYGHAIEKLTDLPHGQSISIGMVMALKLSQKRGLLTQQDAKRIIDLLTRFHLPVSIKLKQFEIFDVIKKDKKRDGESIHFILLNGIGNAIIEKVFLNELENINHE